MAMQASPRDSAAAPAGVQAVQVRARAAEPRRFARWRPRAALLALVLGFVVSQAVAFGVRAVAGGDRDALDGVTAVALVLADLVLIGVVIAFARRGAEHLSAATLGIRRTRFGPALGWLLVVYFGVLCVGALWTLLVGGGVERRGSGGLEAPGTAAALAIVFAIAVMAPIAEEVAFRGYLFPAVTRWRGPWIAAISTSLLFGAAHLLVYPLAILPALAVFGFGACLLFWFTGSLLPCIALHALNNGLAAGFLLGWSWQAPVAALGSIAIALALLAPFARERAP